MTRTAGFGYEIDSRGAGHVVTDRPADYRVELLQNGYARVYHSPSGLTAVVEPGIGVVHSGGRKLPASLIAEIHNRWRR
ncbi:hypothetical protein ACQPZP_40805 [Spirillospora sp. CA-142024]|uniref:hypothetical protein n=1 Tax=Spirillospora sp. CA-142024 TaxID=3240036 RepID=UPI003D8B5985